MVQSFNTKGKGFKLVKQMMQMWQAMTIILEYNYIRINIKKGTECYNNLSSIEKRKMAQV